MDLADVQRQYLNFGSSMYREGYLDEQFGELQKLADESEPSFVLDIVSIFFNDCDRILHNLSNALEKPDLDFSQVSDMVQILKGSSLSIGANKIKDACNTLKIYIEHQNLQECQMCVKKIKQEFIVIKSKLETLLCMHQQIISAGGLVPMIQLF